MIIFMQSLRTWRYLSLSILLLIFLAASVPVRAQSSVSITDAGFDAYYQENQWVPVRLTIENHGENIAGWIEIVISGDGSAETAYTQAINLPAGARKQLTMNIFLSYFTRDLEIEFLTTDKLIASVSVRLNRLYATDRLVGVLSDHPSPYNLLADLDPPNGSAVIVPLEISDLPTSPASWTSLDVLIISDVDSGLLSSAQRVALQHWILKGGHLIVVGGAHWQKTTAGLIDVLPFTPGDSTTLTSLDELLAFSQSVLPLEINSPFSITSGTPTGQAQVLVSQDNSPILVRRQHGLGRIDFLALDPALEPLRSWDGILDLYRAIFYPLAALPTWSSGVINWDAARGAASTLPNLTLPSTLSITCFLGAYVLILGPLNYLILRRVKKREWGWLTIPAIVLLFSFAAILFGSLSRGNRPVLNRMAIIQAWPDTGQAAMSGVVGIYSPRPASVDVLVGEGSLVHTLPSTSGVDSLDTTIQIDSAGQSIPDLRLSAGETIPLVFAGSLPSPAISSDLVLEIGSSGVVLRGSVINDSPLTFTDAALLYPGGSLAIGVFTPGQVQTISVRLTQAQYLDPTPASSSYSYSGPYYPFSGSYFGMQDQTITDIIGSDDYYNDRADYCRYLLFTTHISNQQNPGRGSGIYLTGWMDSFPAEITLTDQAVRMVDTSLYIFSLPPIIQASGDIWVLSPGIFTFSSAADSAASDIAPYNIYLYGDENYDWEFSLAYPQRFSSVHRLEINLSAAQTSLFPAELDVYLWDYLESRWVQQDIGTWGAYSVPEPARYVSTANVVQLRLHYSGVDSVYLSTADISLQVIP
jgi:hypothetical protein